MFKVEGRRARADIREQAEIDGIVRGLEDAGYTALLRSLVRSATEVAGLGSRPLPISALVGPTRRFRTSGGDETPVGDLLFAGNRAYVLQPLNHELYAWEVRHHSEDPNIEAFSVTTEGTAKDCLDGRRLRGMQFTWDPVELQASPLIARPTYQGTAAPELSVKDAIYDERDADVAGLLVSREQREFLIRLAQMRGRARAIDTTAIEDHEATSALLTGGLIRKEYLVQCRGDNRTILSVPDRTALESGAAADFRCPVCGRSIHEELIQDIFAVTDDGQSLMAGSHWMTVWVTTLLEEAGVSRDAIKWNAAAGDDELDIVVSLGGMTFFLELKDRAFGLGDAYPFASRTSRYDADAGAVLCTESIAEEAKTFFRDRGGFDAVPIESVEGEKAIVSRLPALLNQWSMWGIQRGLSDAMEPLGGSVAPMLANWMREQERTATPKARRSKKQAPQPVRAESVAVATAEATNGSGSAPVE